MNCPNKQCKASKDQYGIPKCVHCIRCGKAVDRRPHFCVDAGALEHSDRIGKIMGWWQ